MVDNRSAGFYGIGGAFNFKSGDPSGSAAKMSQEKYGSEAMYLPPLEDEEGEAGYNNEPYIDRSALLRATLNSLAMSNVAGVLNAHKHKKTLKEIMEEKLEEVTEEINEERNKKNRENQQENNSEDNEKNNSTENE